MPRTSRSTVVALAVALLLLALAPRATAQNQVLNAHMTFDASNWVNTFAPNGYHGWMPEDANGSLLGGSLLVGNQSPGAGSGIIVLSTPLRVIIGAPYKVAIKALLPAGQTETGTAYLTVVNYGDFACNNATGYDLDFPIPVVSNQWVHLRRSYVTPPGTACARVGLLISKVEAAGSFEVQFDDVTFVDCDPTMGDVNLDGAISATDLVLLANKLVANISCLPQ